MWQQANGRAISSSGLREGTLARDCARRVVARSMRVGGRVVVVGTMRFRVRWMEAVVEDIVGWSSRVLVWWCWMWEGDAQEVRVGRERGAVARDI